MRSFAVARGCATGVTIPWSEQLHTLLEKSAEYGTAGAFDSYPLFLTVAGPSSEFRGMPAPSLSESYFVSSVFFCMYHTGSSLVFFLDLSISFFSSDHERAESGTISGPIGCRCDNVVIIS